MTMPSEWLINNAMRNAEQWERNEKLYTARAEALPPGDERETAMKNAQCCKIKVDEYLSKAVEHQEEHEDDP